MNPATVAPTDGSAIRTRPGAPLPTLAPPRARSTARVRAMTWEYAWASFSTRDQVWKVAGAEVMPEAGWGRMDVLAALGADGWELCAIDSSFVMDKAVMQPSFYFKRLHALQG